MVAMDGLGGADVSRIRTGTTRTEASRPTGSAAGRADAWQVCATWIDINGAAFSTGVERLASARLGER